MRPKTTTTSVALAPRRHSPTKNFIPRPSSFIHFVMTYRPARVQAWLILLTIVSDRTPWQSDGSELMQLHVLTRFPLAQSDHFDHADQIAVGWRLGYLYSNCPSAFALIIFSWLWKPHILLERKCIREEQVVGGHVIKHMPHSMFNVTAYESFLSDTFSLLKDMQ